MKTISILTPTRKRPNNILKMLESIKEGKSNDNNIEVIFRIDDTDDDLNNKEFKEECYQLIDPRLYINFIIGPETFPDLGCLWNECFKECHGDIIMVGGDDLVYETKDWDRLILSAFDKHPDGIVLVWGNDGTFGSRLATHPIVSRKWVETVGWLFPPIGLTFANDNFIFNLADRLNRLYFIGELSTKHIWDGSNENDPNHGRMMEHFQRSHDVLASNVGQDCMKEAERKLREVMK